MYAFDGRGTFRIDNGYAPPNITMSASNRTWIQREIDEHLILRHGPRAQPPYTSYTYANALYVDGHAASSHTGYLAGTRDGGISVKDVDWRRPW